MEGLIIIIREAPQDSANVGLSILGKALLNKLIKPLIRLRATEVISTPQLRVSSSYIAQEINLRQNFNELAEEHGILNQLRGKPTVVLVSNSLSEAFSRDLNIKNPLGLVVLSATTLDFSENDTNAVANAFQIQQAITDDTTLKAMFQDFLKAPLAVDIELSQDKPIESQALAEESGMQAKLNELSELIGQLQAVLGAK